MEYMERTPMCVLYIYTAIGTNSLNIDLFIFSIVCITNGTYV